jgi:hypothetical protein
MSTANPQDPISQRLQRPRVIYVMGAGRSGSTILGVTLGNCANVLYAGELDAWLVRSGIPQLDDPQRLRFWSVVREGVDGAAGDLFGNEAQRSLERSMAVFRIHKWPARQRLRGRYRRVAEDLYRVVAETAGVTHVVDTSHYPLRARELQSLDGIDLYLVYLIRSPQSVVGSFNRRDVAQYSKSTLTTNVYLWLTNLLAVGVFLSQPRKRRLLVSYEDFIANPEDILGSILEHVNVSAPLPDLSALKTGIAFQGNRLIASEVIALERNTERPRRQSVLTAILQLPWAGVLSRLRPRATIPASGG